MSRRAEITSIGVLLLVAVVVIVYVIATTRPPGPTRTTFAGPDPTLDREMLLQAEGHVRGAADAPYTLISFDDLQCFNSYNAREHVRKAMAQRPGQLRVVTQHFVALPGHVHAGLLARAAEAAGRQGKFWPMHDRLLDRYGRFVRMSDAQVRQVVIRVARDLKLDEARFRRDLDGPEARAAFERGTRLAERLGVRLTPGYFFLGPAGTPVRLSNYALMGDWLADPEHWGPAAN